MPNWCACRVIVEGELEEGKHPLFRLLGGADFRLSLIVPAPPLLSDISEQRLLDKNGAAQVVHLYENPRDTESKRGDGGRVLTHQQVRDLEIRYGASHWYDWNLEHWGTKWDCNDSDVDYSGSEATVTFETAWSPPVDAMVVLSKRLKDCVVTLDYMEPGCDFAGRVVLLNGVCKDRIEDTARSGRDISQWHEDVYGPCDDEEEEEE